MKLNSWKPKKEELDVMEDVWIQIKDSCEKLKKETNAKNGHIRKMLKEISDRYYSSNSD